MAYSFILIAAYITASFSVVKTQSVSLRQALDTSSSHNTIKGSVVDAMAMNPSITLQAVAEGDIKTVAGKAGVAGSESKYSGDGGQAKDATLNGPVGIFVDSKGEIFFSDRNNDVVRKIETSGIISTIAGTGQATSAQIPTSYSGDGGQATKAMMRNPFQVHLYIHICISISFISISMCINMCISIFIYLYVYIYMYISICIHLHVCVNIYLYAWIYPYVF
jgi:hypothetical protein